MSLDPNEAKQARTVEEAELATQRRKAVVASVVGTTIEWYDFFLYGTAAALIFPQVFFPTSSTYAGTLESFATYAVGFAARPVGAALFGHYGDRIGRKAALIATLLLMGIATAAIGVIPSTNSIGLWAPTLLVLMRLLQGVGVGGEWSGSILLSMEWGDQKRRGLSAAYPQMGVPIGLALSALAVKIFSLISGTGFETWGWRIPFLLSLVLIAVGLYIRLSILETPVFAKAIEDKDIAPAPVVEVIRKYPKEILLSAFARLSEQAPFYIFTAFMLTYITEVQGFSSDFALTATVCAALLSLISLPVFGHLSDTLGRKRIYMLGALIVGVGIWPYFAAVTSGVAVVVFAAFVLALVPHDMQYGPQAALIAESFSTNLRYSGAGIGYQLASVIAGGPAPLLATYLQENLGVWAIAIYVSLCSVITLIAVKLMPDRSQIDITQSSSYENEGRVGAPQRASSL
jgi:metabolite-proton symporter